MALTVLQLTTEYLPAITDLLAHRHRADLDREPLLPHRLADTAVVGPLLESVLRTPGATSVVATDVSVPVGYLLGTPLLPSPTSTLAQTIRPRSLRLPYIGHGVVHDDVEQVYRMLYAALAEPWVRAGYNSHYVTVAACDARTMNAWLSLGFAHDRVTGVRSLNRDGLVSRNIAASIRQASLADFETIVALARANDVYHAASPIFDAYLHEAEHDTRQSLQTGFREPDGAVWLAERAGVPLGVLILSGSQEVVAPTERTVHLELAYLVPAARSGGVGTALLAEALRWAQAGGYDWCTATWSTANLLGAQYWPRVGFRPLSYRLCRHIDPRSAWAHRSE